MHMPSNCNVFLVLCTNAQVGRQNQGEREDTIHLLFRCSIPPHIFNPRMLYLSLSLKSIFAVLLHICQQGNTALMLAARYGHVEASRLLLKGKADVNAANHVRCGGWSQCMCGMRHDAGIPV